MATNTNYGQPLAGDQAFDAAQGFSTSSPQDDITALHGAAAPTEQEPLAGMGPLLEDDDQTVFKAVHALVLRQERLARNRLEQDKHYTRLKLGHPWSELKHDENRDTYTASVPRGTTSMAAVPNKGWDLTNKIVETLMSDAPQPAPKAENDSEEAERAAEMAEEFLTQDGTEAGTNDAELFWDALDAAMTKASSFLHLWIDPVGGGYVPLQIKAHPLAQDASKPLQAPDGTPTTDYILRYVSEAHQFVTDPSQAGQQWVPRIRADLRGREHIRCYPETSDVRTAQKLIVLDYCTLGEAKRRWPESVGQMGDGDLGKLCDWTPPRHLALLPKALRARWKLASSEGGDKPGASDDERIMFFYNVYVRPDLDYKRGAHVVVSGYDSGTVIHKETWTANVEMPKGGTDIRCLTIPVVQVRPANNPEDGEPMGRCVFERFAGANEATARLVNAYDEACDIILHPARYTNSVSPVEAEDIEESRATGKLVQVLSQTSDYVKYEEPRPLPPDFLGVIGWHYEQMESIASVNKPVQGADKQQEVSGVARQIAVRQAMVSLGRMQQAVLQAFSRFWRIKLELVQKDFTVPQQIRYEGEDGAYKQEWWTGKDFAQVADVSIQPGTGTMLPPDEKINRLATLVQMQFMASDEAADAARPTFSGTLGIPDDPHLQRLERQIGAWHKGPPPVAEGQMPWVQQYQQYQQEMAAYQPLAAKAQAAQAEHAAAQQDATVTRHPSAPPAPPELPPAPVAPWSPFNPLPHDMQPDIAAKRMRRLATEMSKVRFTSQPPEWQAVMSGEYTRMSQVVAANQPMQPLPRGVSLQMKGDESNVAAEESAATHQPKPTQQAA